MNKTKVAIIGCGTIAETAHIPAYLNNPNAEIKYFCDAKKENAERFVKKYGCGIAVQDYRDILDDPELEAVSVCTPNNTHASISIHCLRAGKNVLCEKPAARTYSEAIQMQKAQHESGKVLNIGMVNRFNKAVNIIKDLIENGELGELYHVYASFRAHRSIPGLGGAFTTKEISGGGVMIDWGIHFLDVVMYCSGDPAPKSVSAQTYSKLGRNMKDYTYMNMWAGPPKLEGVYDVDDFVTAMIRTEGPSITLNGAWAQNIGEDEMFIDFLGDKAGIRLQYGGSFKMYSAKNGVLLETTPKFNPGDHFQNEIDAFLNSIRTGEKQPSHIDTVIISAKMIQAIYDSSEQQKEIIFD
ncbi:Gfo/Idh/MocA family protein [Paenibacillus faecalis]|uniref:Gfo/Idh/MocA family protein n=1 Tax=Paenibacillus faecalis TaxID=2079532 RepID=UPI000D0E939C|nr:Gfo/Idh/MocA family oxidoreductase [Paenibacillus faecalis]